MKKAPWFSTVPVHPKDKEEPIYHDNSNCMEGDNIPEGNNVPGRTIARSARNAVDWMPRAADRRLSHHR